jgi:transposase
MQRAAAIRLQEGERDELERRARSRRGRAEEARVARLILLLAQGLSYAEIQAREGCTSPFITKWKRRFLAERIAGLYARYRGREARALSTAIEAKILAAMQGKPADGSTHWSTRRLAKHLKIHHMMVARTWRKAGIQPHRLKRYMASNDPDFERKAADVIGLYLKPPQHAAVFCVDEKTAIQALDRRDPILPLSPGRAERHGFEYVRHGTLSLYAAFDTRTGEVFGMTAARHTSREFVAFLEDLLSRQPDTREVHVILDNLSAHKTKAVQDLLSRAPRLRLHFTPTYASWLNQVELWFSKIERDLIHRGIFTSVPNLARRIRRYIHLYNRAPKPIKWRYADPTHRIATQHSSVTVH